MPTPIPVFYGFCGLGQSLGLCIAQNPARCTKREIPDSLVCHGTSDQYDSLAGRSSVEKR
jgi:hypothetical protein